MFRNMTSLPNLITDYMITGGPDAKATLAEKSGLSQSLIEKARAGKNVRPDTAFRLATALGRNERDAKKIAEFYLPPRARKVRRTG